MTRPIEFRAWDDSSKSMIENAKPHLAALYNQPLMQFTGLLDRNGKKIFEGDILKYNSESCNYTFKIPTEFDYSCECCQQVWGWVIDKYAIEKSEIIGNIFETPELLK